MANINYDGGAEIQAQTFVEGLVMNGLTPIAGQILYWKDVPWPPD